MILSTIRILNISKIKLLLLLLRNMSYPVVFNVLFKLIVNAPMITNIKVIYKSIVIDINSQS